MDSNHQFDTVLLSICATPSTMFPEEGDLPKYSDKTQRAYDWRKCQEEALSCADKGTGRPSTRSSTTHALIGSDDDTDDSGT